MLSLHFSLDSEQGQRNEPLDLFRLSAYGPSGAYHQSFSTLHWMKLSVNDACELLANIRTSTLFSRLGLGNEIAFASFNTIISHYWIFELYPCEKETTVSNDVCHTQSWPPVLIDDDRGMRHHQPPPKTTWDIQPNLQHGSYVAYVLGLRLPLEHMKCFRFCAFLI